MQRRFLAKIKRTGLARLVIPETGIASCIRRRELNSEADQLRQALGVELLL